ncbi:MAG: hypothetical protein WCB53_14800 [Terriglobales bacterium]
MKPTIAISVWVLAAGLAVAQNPSVIQNTRATMNGVSATTAAASNSALKTPLPQTATGQSAATSVAHPKRHHGSGTHAKKTASAPKVEKAAATKVEPASEKKVGEIVGSPEAAADGTSGDEDASSQKYNANGKRDPFISPVVAHVGGSGCQTGKKCLEIGSINLRGIVHGENGFIAVVSNGLNKAYFLHENDPVFNGYVVKITGDSIVFQETLQDRLGKTFTREVTKKITTPAV